MQQRTLIRTSDLAAFRSVLVELSLEGDPLAARRRAVIVPTRASAELLRQTIELTAARLGRPALLLPDLVTRDEWLARLHEALPGAPRMLTRVERERLLERAARRTAARARMPGPPFQIRPGLVSGMLDLYDELRRRQRTVRRFARFLFDQLRVERGTDRGSEGLVHQTCFLGFTFLDYERGVVSCGALDEPGLRRRLLTGPSALPYDHVVVAVADHPSDPRGLWPADFDLLGRLAGLSRLDVVVTDETHDAGFRERAEQELPGILDVRRGGASRGAAVLIRPAGRADARCFISRDREEELRDVARRIRRRAIAAGGELSRPVAVVFERRLPYLYLAQQVFTDARVPFQAFDALPLGAEPYAALLDLVLAMARTGGTREAAVALLRSRLLRVEVEGARVGLRDAAALDAVLAARRATAGAETYPAEVASYFDGRETRDRVDRARAARAASAAAEARQALDPFRSAATASGQVEAVSGFLRRCQQVPAAGDPWRERHLRARAAVLGVLDALAAAFRAHDDQPRHHRALVAAIHHAIEQQTFAPARGHGGVHLVDAVAARFGEFDHVHLVGLVETDWPERPRRSVFYTNSLLSAIGWPQERDQLRAQQAAFRDLLGLAAETLHLHAFELDGDAVVALSPMIEAARELPSREAPASPPVRTFSDEVLASDAPPPAALDPDPAAWLDLRLRRPPLDDRRYGGFVAPQAPQAYRVSKVERYVLCPFKYFSESVLGLPEEREEMSGLTPIERGTLIHLLFERFFRTWQEQGRGAITPETLPDARDLFARLAGDALSGLPEADRALEEARLLGSIVARGLGDRVFELEADAGVEVSDRLIEFDVRGPFTFPELAGLRQTTIEIRGKTDRIDVFADGSIGAIDYKLGRLPDMDSSLQIGVYAHCARQWLEARDGRPHPIVSAKYLAFGDDREFEGRLGSAHEPAALAVEARASEFARTVGRIEAGEFPPRPRKPGECQFCRYAGVCRKEYRMEDDVAAEPV
jgi:RecB family exonuclease